MSKIIGTCLGEYVREEDVLYDPQTDTYKIKAGDRIMEIPGHVLKSESLRTLKEALSNVDDENIKTDILGTWAKARSKPIDYNGDEAYDDIYRKTYLGDWGQRAATGNLSGKTPAAAGLAGAPLDSRSQDPLRARVEAGGWRLDGLGASVRPADMGDWSVRISDKAAKKLAANSVYGSGVGTASQRITGTKTFGDSAKLAGGWSGLADYRKPWDDPLADTIHKAENTVACMDMPEYRPDYNPNEQVKVYYHDRYPSIPLKSIIDDAIEMLNKNKNLHITKITFHTEKFGDQEISLAFAADHPADPGLRKILEVVFTRKAFDRAYQTDLDKYAGLKARLDTNTFIKLRIAYLLYQALKLNDSDAKKISLDIFRIFASDTRQNFHI